MASVKWIVPTELWFAPECDAEAALRDLKDVQDKGGRAVLRKYPAVLLWESKVPAVLAVDSAWAAAVTDLVPQDVGSLAKLHSEHEPGSRLVGPPTEEAERPAEPGIGTPLPGGS